MFSHPMNTKIRTCYAFLVFAILCSACKNQAVDYFGIVDEQVKPKSDSVTITGTCYSFNMEVNDMKIKLGKNEELVDAVSHDMVFDKTLEGYDFLVSIGCLQPNTTYYYRYVVDLGLKEHYLTKIENFTTCMGKPTVKTFEVLDEDIDSTSCVVRCEVTSDNGASIIERGVYWNTTGNLDTCTDKHVKHGENATGEYACLIDSLIPNTQYFVYAYAKNTIGTGLGEMVDFQTKDSPESGRPSVKTAEIDNATITATSAKGGGTVDNEGQSHVTRYGVCWGTEHKPTIENDSTIDGSGLGPFSSSLTNLTPNTTYYVRAYAINSQGPAYGREVSFKTSDMLSYTISTSTNPNEGGTVEGGGVFHYGDTCTVRATPANGFTFIKWTENDSLASYNANYTFNVTGDRTLVAQFQAQSYTIKAIADPTIGGTVSGGGMFFYGQSCTLTATPAANYNFVKWTKNDHPVDTNAIYTLRVTESAEYVAHFDYNGGGGDVPTGAINGLFSVSNSKQVWFSMGNLQYNKSREKWNFMEHQWSTVETSDQNVGDDYSSQNIVSLFGWGTSGYDNGQTCYQPYCTSGNDNDYYSGHLLGNLDWGYNAISNGGDEEHKWRTLTSSEWDYLLNQRRTESNIRYAKAKVNDIPGLIILPDDWDKSIYLLNSTNIGTSNYDSNPITATDWTNVLEANGAVFLPAGGRRIGNEVRNVRALGLYWSSSNNEGDNAYYLYFRDNTISATSPGGCHYGNSVRLVFDKP